MLTPRSLGAVSPVLSAVVGPHEQGSSVGPNDMSQQDSDDVDLESVYSHFCPLAGDNSTVIIQNTQRLSATEPVSH